MTTRQDLVSPSGTYLDKRTGVPTTMHSMTLVIVFGFVGIIVFGGLYVAIRVSGSRAVDNDHPKDTPRPGGGSKPPPTI